ncbi:MAG TPA: phosphatidate cytidylyltransferase, partial [Pirellulaceae bacterium]|nr:phosphatidate cytidylyltransferase [Pirellulaceae bacterium]
SLDNFYAFFTALFAEIICLIAAGAILADKPQGYIQRCAIGMFGFMLFGVALAHLGYLANDKLFRPMILLVLLSVELNDVFAFCAGKLLGHRKLIPHTSPNKTIAGSLGAIIGTSVVVYFFGRQIFAGTVLQHPGHLLALGIMISVVGQLGDLMLSSVKRDLSIKDMSDLIPGHGGLLDRFDSLILVGPAVFHYVNYFHGIGTGEQTRIFSGTL